MLIGIGSENKTKITACKIALRQILTESVINHEDVQFRAIPTRTEVPDMPLTMTDIRNGARQRAIHVQLYLPEADISIGLEGGVFIPDEANHDESYLQNWVYAYDGLDGFFGSSPCLPLPRVITQALYQEKRELSDVIDSFSGKTDVRSNEGAFGILTKNLITRTDSFVSAILCALTPLIFKKTYQLREL